MIQKLILNSKKETKDLYYKGKKYSDRNIEEVGILIYKDGSMTFDTYFNAFSIKKWKKYTRIKNLELEIETQGKYKITVMGATSINKQTFKEREVISYVYNDSVKTIHHIKIDTKGEDEIFFFKINSINSEVHIFGGGYKSDVIDLRNNDTKIAIGICTFKREDFVLKNIELLRSQLFKKESEVRDKFKVFVADNGNTLPFDELSDDNIMVYPNANLGGSGGFCRCMLEAFFRKDSLDNFSHILLMDDDIWFEVEMLNRLYHFLSLLRDEYINAMIAFSMFPIEDPCVQYTKGKIREHNVSNCLKHNINLQFFKNILINEREDAAANFSGWWCHCIPANYIQSNNLPFPFFIRCDDTEYGCRYENTIITLNGFGIWHPSFEGKHPISMGYYDKRNNLIFMTESINDITKETLLIELWFAYKNALYMDYEKAIINMKGIEDFIKGPGFLKSADYIAINNSIREMNYKYVSPPEKEKPKLDFIYNDLHDQYSYEMLKLFSILPAFRTKYINYDVRYASLLNVRKLYCYNPETQTGYYLKKSRIKAWKCRKMYVKLRNAIEQNYVSIVNSWRNEFQSLVSLDNWLFKLNLPKEEYKERADELQVAAYQSSPLVDVKDNIFVKTIKHTFPWYSKFGKYLRDNYLNAPHFTIRSDFKMHLTYFKRKLLSILGLSGLNKEMREIRTLKNIHEGKRCFITCTGPSLTINDLEKLDGEYTFGVNSITKAYEFTSWRPTYYVLIDAYAYGETLSKSEVPGGVFCKEKSFFHYRAKPMTRNGNELFIPINYGNHWESRMKRGIIKINNDISVGVYDCFTVTNMAISIAAYMGFKDIYIIGADATYKLEKTHFIEGEWEKVHKKAQRGLAIAVQRSMMGYVRTKEYYNKRGVNIYNATRGGMLEVFPRVDLDEVLAEKSAESIIENQDDN